MHAKCVPVRWSICLDTVKSTVKLLRWEHTEQIDWVCVLKCRKFTGHDEIFIPLCAMCSYNFCPPAELSWGWKYGVYQTTWGKQCQQEKFKEHGEGYLFSCSPVARHKMGRGKRRERMLLTHYFRDFKKWKKRLFREGQKMNYIWVENICVCMREILWVLVLEM